MKAQLIAVVIQELYKFKLSHNAAKANKKIYYTKGKSAVDHSRVTRWSKKFHLVMKGQKTVDSETVL